MIDRLRFWWRAGGAIRELTGRPDYLVQAFTGWVAVHDPAPGSAHRGVRQGLERSERPAYNGSIPFHHS